MSNPATLKVETSGERDIVVTRAFKAPSQLVWDAHTKPELVRKWMLGPPGWTMPECEIDLKVGGKIRYEWRNSKSGEGFGLIGEYKEVAAPKRSVHWEAFTGFAKSEPADVTTEFAEENGKTVMTMTIHCPSAEARAAALATGMTDGMGMSYDLLDDVLAGAR